MNKKTERDQAAEKLNKAPDQWFKRGMVLLRSAQKLLQHTEEDQDVLEISGMKLSQTTADLARAAGGDLQPAIMATEQLVTAFMLAGMAAEDFLKTVAVQAGVDMQANRRWKRHQLAEMAEELNLINSDWASFIVGRPRELLERLSAAITYFGRFPGYIPGNSKGATEPPHAKDLAEHWEQVLDLMIRAMHTFRKTSKS